MSALSSNSFNSSQVQTSHEQSLRQDLMFSSIIATLATLVLFFADEGGQGLSALLEPMQLLFLASLFIGMFSGLILTAFYLRKMTSVFQRRSFIALMGLPMGFIFYLTIMIAGSGFYFAL